MRLANQPITRSVEIFHKMSGCSCFTERKRDLSNFHSHTFPLLLRSQSWVPDCALYLKQKAACNCHGNCVLVTSSRKRNDVVTLCHVAFYPILLGENVTRHWPQFDCRTSFQMCKKYTMNIFSKIKCIHLQNAMWQQLCVKHTTQIWVQFASTFLGASLAACASLWVVFVAVRNGDRKRSVIMIFCTYEKHRGRRRSWRQIRGLKAQSDLHSRPVECWPRLYSTQSLRRC